MICCRSLAKALRMLIGTKLASSVKLVGRRPLWARHGLRMTRISGRHGWTIMMWCVDEAEIL